MSETVMSLLHVHDLHMYKAGPSHEPLHDMLHSRLVGLEVITDEYWCQIQVQTGT